MQKLKKTNWQFKQLLENFTIKQLKGISVKKTHLNMMWLHLMNYTTRIKLKKRPLSLQ